MAWLRSLDLDMWEAVSRVGVRQSSSQSYRRVSAVGVKNTIFLHPTQQNAIFEALQLSLVDFLRVLFPSFRPRDREYPN